MSRAPASDRPASRELRTIRWIFLASLAPALALLAVLVARRPTYAPIAAAILAYALLAWAGLEWIGRRAGAGIRSGAGWGPFLALAVLHLVVLAPEVALRVAGFRFETGIQFGFPSPAAFARLVHDEKLFWTFPPERADINAWGFRGPEVGAPEPGRPRVVFLGDSVPYGGYPSLVARLLDTSGRPVEVVNLSLPGYSSFQGRRLLERYGDRLAADAAVISYGWNDHWPAWIAVDAEKRVRVPIGVLERTAVWLRRHARTLQASLALRAAVTGMRERPLAAFRVPPDAYRGNLEILGRALEAQRTTPLLVTPPAAFDRLGTGPAYPAAGPRASDESVAELHRRYNRIVREAAAAGGWQLLDLEADLEGRPDLGALFTADGIHLTPAGEQAVAEHVAAVLASLLGRDG